MGLSGIDNIVISLYHNSHSSVRSNVNRSRYSLDSHSGLPEPAHTGRIWTIAAFLLSTSSRIAMGALDNGLASGSYHVKTHGTHNSTLATYSSDCSTPLVKTTMAGFWMNGKLRLDWCINTGRC